jgi:flagellar hook-associated protein 2
LTEKQPPADAVVKVDGFTYTSASNTVTGALGGVTLNLAATTTAPVTLSIAADTSQVQPKIQALVDAYNGLFKVLDDQGGYDAASKKAGPLMGDPALRSLTGQLRRALTDPVSGALGVATTAADLGLSVDSHGALSLAADKLQALLTADPGALSTVLQGSAGIATRLSTVIGGYMSSGGLLASRTDSINHSLSDISDQRDALSARMDDLQARYLRQFNALDGLLSQMQSTGNFLTQQLASLPGAKSSVK